MGKLDGKVAVITGGTSGMALATAKLFVAEGAEVFITGRRQEQLDKAVKEIGKNVTGVQGDAGTPGDLDRLYAAVGAAKKKIDVLFASAGIGNLDEPLAAVTEESFDKVFDVNVRGTLLTVQKALPSLRDGASVILNGSIAGSKGIAGASVYCASKAAVRSFARTWTSELKDRKIRVNVLSPGPIDTPVFDGLPAEKRDAMKAFFTATVPMGRMGKSEEIATAALFLASSDSSFVTGIELFVDGGTAQV
jgi:NAD(P)-dependent dehydrogenase (short-subunit alcohol dehydrogenase family)